MAPLVATEVTGRALPPASTVNADSCGMELESSALS